MRKRQRSNRHQVQITDNNRSRTIMQFGNAQLVQTAEGKLELKNATKDEQTEAKEYISLFCHEAVVSFAECSDDRTAVAA